MPDPGARDSTVNLAAVAAAAAAVVRLRAETSVAILLHFQQQRRRGGSAATNLPPPAILPAPPPLGPTPPQPSLPYTNLEASPSLGRSFPACVRLIPDYCYGRREDA